MNQTYQEKKFIRILKDRTEKLPKIENYQDFVSEYNNLYSHIEDFIQNHENSKKFNEFDQELSRLSSLLNLFYSERESKYSGFSKNNYKKRELVAVLN